jgi:predicted SnoaL-like aldol condensation-catalyzing enzyme
MTGAKVRSGRCSKAVLVLGIGAGLGASAALALATGAFASAPTQPAAQRTSGTIGLVLTGWRYGLQESPDYKECGGKLDPGPVAQLRATPGAIERIKAEGGSFEQTGPNGESPQNNPLLFNDPLPVPELVTKTGYGLNLDGTRDGRATARTCGHEKFDSADGSQKVDNQLSRVFGCVQGYRTGGQTAEYYNQEIVTYPINRHLIEITGVDDEQNDPAVVVNIYKGYDRLVRSGENKFVPYLSQRIDPRYPQYTMRTTGRIENGVLITDPIPQALLPHSSQRKIADRDMRDMTLRLKLTADGAEGMLAGYDNWRHLWNAHAKRVTAELNKQSSPTIYRRFMRYADGYPDASGQCGYISSAYRVTAVRATIVHPNQPALRVAKN